MLYSIAVELCSKLEDHVQPDEALILSSWLVVLHSQFIHQLTYGLIYLALSPDVSYSRSTALLIRSTSLTTKSLPGPSKPGSPSGSPLGKSAGEARWGSPLGKSSAFGQRLCCTTSIVSPLCSQRRTARSSMDSGKRELDESVWGKGKANAVING
jgi:hypothetical protein